MTARKRIAGLFDPVLLHAVIYLAESLRMRPHQYLEKLLPARLIQLVQRVDRAAKTSLLQHVNMAGTLRSEDRLGITLIYKSKNPEEQRKKNNGLEEHRQLSGGTLCTGRVTDSGKHHQNKKANGTARAGKGIGYGAPIASRTAGAERQRRKEYQGQQGQKKCTGSINKGFNAAILPAR